MCLIVLLMKFWDLPGSLIDSTILFDFNQLLNVWNEKNTFNYLTIKYFSRNVIIQTIENDNVEPFFWLYWVKAFLFLKVMISL